MGKRWYGSIANRIDENNMFCKEIKVGTQATEYFWSDRHPYEVTKVINQKHVFIREMDAFAVGPSMSNTWRLESNPEKPEQEVKYRYNSWYKVYHSAEGKIYYSKVNLSFGIAEKYFDYEF